MKPFGMRGLFAALGVATVAAAVSPAEAQELKFWIRSPFPLEQKALEDVSAKFAEANPGVTVKMESRSIDEHKSALRVASASREGPDFYYMWAGLGLGGEFVDAGLSAPLDKYYEQYKWDDRLRSTAISYTKLYAGGRHGVPYKINSEALYYSKDLFEKAGITELPETYDELLGAAQKLKDAGIPAITFGGSVNWHIMRLMDVILETKCGVETHDALKAMKADWSKTSCAVESFTELHKWSSEYFLRPFMGYDQPQSFRYFMAGRAAMMLEGDWLVDQIKSSSIGTDKFGIFPFPTGTGRLYGFGVNLYVSSYSEHQDLVAKNFDYMLSDEVQQRLYGAFGSIPVNKNVVLENLDPLDATWLDIVGRFDSVFLNGDQAFPLDVTTEYFRVINEVVSDGLSPEQAADALQAFIDQRG